MNNSFPGRLASVFLFSVVSGTLSPLGVPTTEPFNNSLTVDPKGNYVLYWNFNNTHVTFEVHVKTRGYVGFGLSPNGNMYPADVVVGWVKDGTVYFKVMLVNVYLVMTLLVIESCLNCLNQFLAKGSLEPIAIVANFRNDASF